mgnify:CR=1 FL=1
MNWTTLVDATALSAALGDPGLRLVDARQFRGATISREQAGQLLRDGRNAPAPEKEDEA